MISVHSLQVGDVCRWPNPRDHPHFRGFFVVRRSTPDAVLYEIISGPRTGQRFYNNGFQDIILVREAMTPV